MLPQNLISWSKVPVCSLRTLVLMDIFDQYKEWFELLLKKKYGDITAGLIVCGDDYPLEATIARRCLKLISSIDAPFFSRAGTTGAKLPKPSSPSGRRVLASRGTGPESVPKVQGSSLQNCQGGIPALWV